MSAFLEDDILDILLWGIICGVIGARVYYVLFSLSSYEGRWLSVFNIREGGLAIYGGFIGAISTIFLLCRKKKLSFFAILDVFSIGGVVGQCIGRWGKFFNREAFGGYSTGIFSVQLPMDAVRQPDAITAEMKGHAFLEDGIYWISVHPTFLYESLWNFWVFLILYFVIRPRKRWDGEVFAWYLLLYGAGRFWIEALRSDSLLFFGTDVPVSRCIAALCVVASSAVLFYKEMSERS